jgi:fumarate hydratase class II
MAVESDSLGEGIVPDDAYYGAQTARARDNFPVALRGLPFGLIRALGRVKEAAAQANAALGLLPHSLASAIAAAAGEVADGSHDRQFVVDIFQTGSGTSSNMNANEVIAKRANELITGRRHPKTPIHPNDHVNLGQSSNDVFPTAIHLAVLLALDRELVPALGELQGEFAARAEQFDGVVKIGRTHLQDAIPVRLGQELAGYARMIERGIERMAQARPVLEEVALGATAVGTGLNTHPEFADRTLAIVNSATSLKMHPSRNRFESLGSRHALVFTSGALKTLACDLMKIANDLRLLASGPRCGIGEIALPELQPGSSIMPAKVNPVIPESICQVAAQVIGNDAAIAIGAQSGLLELNVMMPLMAANLLESLQLTANVSRLFATRCIRGLEARPQRCTELVEQSLALATALVPRIGYDAAARLAQAAHRENRPLREIALRDSGLSSAELDTLLDVKRMTGAAP